MSKKALPLSLKMRHDAHYVEEISKNHRVIGRVLPLDKIEPNPEQPRVEIGDLTDLTASIKEKGVLEPLLVKPVVKSGRWLIIAGERRWRAAQAAGLAEVPCIELDVSEQDIAEIALIENLQRKDLTVWEEADALESLSRRFGYTHEDLAKKIGKSRTTVTESLTIANLPGSVREDCIARGITTKAAVLQIARQFDERSMFEAIKQISQKVRKTDLKSNQGTYVQKSRSDDPNLSESGGVRSNNEVKSFPVRVFSYTSPEKDYRVEIKFKKAVEKESFKKALNEILNVINEE